MSLAQFRIFSRRHLPWLVWLALLMPAAQAAASWHLLSHQYHEAEGTAGSTKALHPLHCGLCLAAASVAAGVPPGASLSLPPPSQARYAPPQAHSSGGWLAPLERVYESRAPPLIQH